MSNPIVKWAGGKRKLVPFIEPLLGEGSRLVEPFAGGAALTLAVGERFDRIWLNDVNPDLVNVYRHASDPVLVSLIESMFCDENNTQDRYTSMRARFNGTERLATLERAAIFVWLNKHGFNGLCRYNKRGDFNVPWGHKQKTPAPPIDELRAFPLDALVTCLDFGDVLNDCGHGDVVYCDPPYVPLTATANFTAYTERGFGLGDHGRLAASARSAAGRGARVLISNHDTPLAREMYDGAEIHTVDVTRSISCRGATRGRAPELVAVFGPVDNSRDD